MSAYYSEPIPPPLYRLHPAFGVRPVGAGELISLDPAELPPEWQQLPESIEDEMFYEWNADLLETIASRGESKLRVDLSDRLGLTELLSLPECSPGPRSLSIICDATSRAIRALVRTNPTDLVQTVDSNAYLTLVGSWDAVFLHVEERSILDRLAVLLFAVTGEGRVASLSLEVERWVKAQFGE